MKKPETSELLFSLSLSIIVLLISTMVMKSYEVLTLRAVAIGIMLTACIFFGLVWLVLTFESKHHREDLDLILSRLSELVPPTGVSWLYRDEDLAKAESEAKGDSIWIISPDLANVTGKPIISDAVKKNVKRRITYTFIVPDSNLINGRLPGLRDVFRSNPKQLKIIKLPEDQFSLLSVTHIAVFNANGAPLDAFLELPIEEAAGKKIRGYWIKVGKDAASGLAGRFSRIIEAHKTKDVASLTS